VLTVYGRVNLKHVGSAGLPVVDCSRARWYLVQDSLYG